VTPLNKTHCVVIAKRGVLSWLWTLVVVVPNVKKIPLGTTDTAGSMSVDLGDLGNVHVERHDRFMLIFILRNWQYKSHFY